MARDLFSKAINTKVLNSLSPEQLAQVNAIFDKPKPEPELRPEELEPIQPLAHDHHIRHSYGEEVDNSHNAFWIDDGALNPIEQGYYDDDPSPYDGTYSES